MSRLRESTPDERDAVYGGWLAALQLSDTEDVRQVLLRIRLGDDEPIPAYEWESTGAILRRRADQISRQRREIPRDRSGEAELPPSGISQTIGAALAAVKGLSPAERRAKLREMVPEDVRDSVKCRDCNDEGMVNIVHHLTLRAIFAGKLAEMKRTDWKTYPVPCTCREGKRWLSEPNKHSEGRQRRCNHQLDCRVPRAGMTACYEYREQIVDWCKAYDAARSRPNYSPELEGAIM